MSAILFSPHNDDETLFAFYTMVRYQAECVVVLRSVRQERQQAGPTAAVRERETECATRIAGVPYIQWREFADDNPDWEALELMLRAFVLISKPDVVIGPAWEEGGHEDHNGLARIVERLHGNHALVQYLTYKRGHGRSTEGTEIIPTVAQWAQKRAALLCYQSQANHPPTASWFSEDQREFVL